VPSAARVPCVRSLLAGWTFAGATAGDGRSVITIDNDRAALRLTHLPRTAPAVSCAAQEAYSSGGTSHPPAQAAGNSHPPATNCSLAAA